MGVPVFVLGASGTGKTYSIKNFDEKEVGVFSVEKNRLPFKKKFMIIKNATYDQIMKSLANPTLKSYVIDDSQYLLVNELFDKVNQTGYGKFTDMAKHFRDLVHFINLNVPDDVIVYFLHHTEVNANGTVKAKTVGKMLDDTLTLEGCFDIVLNTRVESGQYYFITQNDGNTTAKSPEEMFDLKIPNDLKMVDEIIREYYNI